MRSVRHSVQVEFQCVDALWEARNMEARSPTKLYPRQCSTTPVSVSPEEYKKIFQFFALWLYENVFVFSAMLGATDTRSYDSLSPLEPLTESFTPQS